jgi:hypothetical protein
MAYRGACSAPLKRGCPEAKEQALASVGRFCVEELNLDWAAAGLVQVFGILSS